MDTEDCGVRCPETWSRDVALPSAGGAESKGCAPDSSMAALCTNVVSVPELISLVGLGIGELLTGVATAAGTATRCVHRAAEGDGDRPAPTAGVSTAIGEADCGATVRGVMEEADAGGEPEVEGEGPCSGL